jgi:hypothetical protein
VVNKAKLAESKETLELWRINDVPFNMIQVEGPVDVVVESLIVNEKAQLRAILDGFGQPAWRLTGRGHNVHDCYLLC